MNPIGTIADIPMAHVAFTKWMSCILYLVLCNKEALKRKKSIFTLGISFVLLLAVHIFCGKAPLFLWLPGVLLTSAAIMYATFFFCGNMTKLNAGYWMVRAFILAELTASLEWQIYSFATEYLHRNSVCLQLVFLIGICESIYILVYFIERKQNIEQFNVTKKELSITVSIGLVTFLMSNLSYVYANTPFSSPIAQEAFNIRTLINLGGFAFLLTNHIQSCENHMKAELDAIQNILHIQYSQYRMSKENIDMINHKYHDLKHQIAILRKESNSDKREEYLSEIERGITDYELQFKTGNGVLDTILTSKSMQCARHGITLTCVADGSLLNQIYVMDLCTIFGNALDNAIECETQIEDKEKRLIHVSVSRFQAFILIRVENYIENNVKFKDDLPVTTKPEKGYHGFGIKSIRYSVEKYNGTLTVTAKDNWFVLKALIPCNPS